jgi:hypothetical protein
VPDASPENLLIGRADDGGPTRPMLREDRRFVLHGAGGTDVLATIVADRDALLDRRRTSPADTCPR